MLCDFYGAFVIPSEVPVECEGDFFVDGKILHKDLKDNVPPRANV